MEEGRVRRSKKRDGRGKSKKERRGVKWERRGKLEDVRLHTCTWTQSTLPNTMAMQCM